MKKLIIILVFQISMLYAQTNLLIPFSKNKKIGFINNQLEIVVDPVYDSIVRYKGSSFILYDVSKKCNILQTGKEKKNVQNLILLGDGYYSMYYEPDTYIYDTMGKRIRVLSKLQHDHNSTYEYMIVFNGVSENIIKQDNTYIFNDSKILEIYDYDPLSETALCRYKGKGYCLITKDGLKNQDKYTFCIHSMHDSFVFGKNLRTEECGFYNMNCELVIKADILSNSTLDDWNCYPGICCGVTALVNDGEKNILLSEYQTMHSNNWSIVDCAGKFLEYGITADKIYPFSDDVAVLMVQINKKKVYRLIGKNGKIITDRDYDFINPSINGYCMAIKDGVDYLISSKDGTVYKCSDFK